MSIVHVNYRVPTSSESQKATDSLKKDHTVLQEHNSHMISHMISDMISHMTYLSMSTPVSSDSLCDSLLLLI